ncbi:MAG: glycosyltransferase family 1 protein [Acidimicrobiales bacterium]
MRLAVDATSLLGTRTGVGTMTAAIVERLGRRDGIDLRLFAVTWRGRGELGATAPPGATVLRRPLAARPLRAAWRRSELPPVEWFAGRVDVVHGPNFVVPPARRAGRVVTVHDLTVIRYPEMCTADTLQYPALLRRAVAHGAWVHTVSAFVADEVRDAFPIDPDKVVVVPNGIDPLAGGDPAEGRRLAGRDRYVLAIGTIEPRKDFPTLVAAFDELAAEDEDVGLVIAGPEGWGEDDLRAALRHAHHRDRITRIGFVDAPTRASLLQGAAAFAYPSVYEGFGLPPLEAMAAGVPVVATAAGAVPEVVGDAARLVPVGDPSALAGALAEVLADEAVADRLRRTGHDRVSRFSWDATVDGLVSLYERARSTPR